MVRGLGGGDRWWLRNFKFAFCFLCEMSTWAPKQVFGIIPSPSDALAVAKTIPPGPIGGERRMALMPEASIRGLQQYIESLMAVLCWCHSQDIIPGKLLAYHIIS